MSTERTVRYDILSHLCFLYYTLLSSSHLRPAPTISFSPQGFPINNVCICILGQARFMFDVPHSLSQQRSGFESKADRVGFVVHEGAVGQVYLLVIWSSPERRYSIQMFKTSFWLGFGFHLLSCTFRLLNL